MFVFFPPSSLYFVFVGPRQWITKTVNPQRCLHEPRHDYVHAGICLCSLRFRMGIWNRTHVHMCICVSFILALALSGVTSAPFAAPGLTQYAHKDEDHPRPDLLQSQRCKCHLHTHSYRHTPHTFMCMTSSFISLAFCSAISIIFNFTCVCVCASSVV